MYRHRRGWGGRQLAFLLTRSEGRGSLVGGGEGRQLAFILKRSHVFQFMPLSCEMVQCSPCELGRSGKLSAAMRCIAPPPPPETVRSSALSDCARARTSAAGSRLSETPHRPRDTVWLSIATSLSTWK